ncbi:hypothetical protein NLJ89_g6954 [Agrocybe chaxingu]|uniref:Uncharacterized protein n=1 Tax=Agrocybe chaxingu TaxID=84603 RepID=A0A9W8MVX2_9AGAR|nr:hypothetical protein NLJ89_g6954 [Agrocybe chaxingu]
MQKKFARKIRRGYSCREDRRDIHGRRFFLKIDDGHKRRINLLENEMVRAAETIRMLETRAYSLFSEWKPDSSQLPRWGRMSRQAIGDAKKNPNHPEDADLIDMKAQVRKLPIVDAIIFTLDNNDKSNAFDHQAKE